MNIVFLSASVPLPNRHPRFMSTADVVAIRESVKALVSEVVPRGRLVFGGHPAITPLIALLLRNLDPATNRRITLYQSEYFSRNFLPENSEFVDVEIVPSIRKSKKRSLAAMRKKMITSYKFDAGVFIGGMEGVKEEFLLFTKTHPDAQRWIIGSTGAAAEELYEQSGKPRPDYFMHELTYATLFRNLMRELPGNVLHEN